MFITREFDRQGKNLTIQLQLKLKILIRIKKFHPEIMEITEGWQHCTKESGFICLWLSHLPWTHASVVLSEPTRKAGPYLPVGKNELLSILNEI